jgi:outer membrane protein assembly factor BamB
MAVANINTVDSSISYATIDNELYAYYLYTAALAEGDVIYGARITYTL